MIPNKNDCLRNSDKNKKDKILGCKNVNISSINFLVSDKFINKMKYKLFKNYYKDISLKQFVKS